MSSDLAVERTASAVIPGFLVLVAPYLLHRLLQDAPIQFKSVIPTQNLNRTKRQDEFTKTNKWIIFFYKRVESEYDSFGADHSTNSISAGLGMADGRDLMSRKNNMVAVIGDGTMTARQAYKAMKKARFFDSDMIVILNDNKQVSLPMLH